LLQNSLGHLLHLRSGDRGGGAEVAPQEASAVHGCVVIGGGSFVGEDAGHQGNDHGDYGNSDDNDEDDLDDAVVFLQETNHGVMATFKAQLLVERNC
jgi:hypothetical protein